MTSTANRAADSHEIRALTGIRGVAAVVVVFFHFQYAWVVLLPSLGVIEPMVSYGFLAVDLFFILSGFILCYVYRAGETAYGLRAHGKFLLLRLARIYPNHLVTLLFFVCYVFFGSRLMHIKLSDDYPLSGLPYQFTLMQSWPFVRGGEWNFPSWSISTEWFAYLFIFPLCWRLLRRDWSDRTLILLGFAALGGRLLLLAPWPALLNLLAPYGPTLRAVAGFIAGSLFFGAYYRRRDGAFNVFCQRRASWIGALMLLVSALPLPSPCKQSFLILLMPMLLVGLTAETSWLAHGLATPVALWLGKVSYALYMSHAIAIKLLVTFLPVKRFTSSGLPVRLGVLLANGVVILALAVGLHYLVEVPGRNLLRHATRRKATQA